MDVDFAPPVGYVEPQRSVAANQLPSTSKPGEQQKLPSYPIKYPLIKKENQIPYAGEGYRLDGKATKKPNSSISESLTEEVDLADMPRGVPNYDYTIGILTFNRNANMKKQEPMATEEDKKKQAPLGGTGYKLKHIGRKP